MMITREIKPLELTVYKLVELGVSVCGDPSPLVTAGAADPGVSGDHLSQWPDAPGLTFEHQLLSQTSPTSLTQLYT